MSRSADEQSSGADPPRGSAVGTGGTAPTSVPFLPIVATLGVAALVGISSQGAPVWTELRDGRAERAQVLDRIAELGMVGLIVAAAITWGVHHFVLARRPGAPPLRQTMLRGAPIAVVSVALLILLALAGTGRDPERGGGGAMNLDWFPGLGLANDPMGHPVDGERIAEPPAEEVPPPPENFRLNPLLLVLFGLLVAAIAGATLWWGRRPAVGPVGLEEPMEESAPVAGGVEARETLIGMIEAMLRDPDPRTAIIGAYARLLDSLAGHGAPRRQYEAPVEHLRRALFRLRVPADPLRTLVELFELARFSNHPLSESHRQKALRALKNALEDLEGPSERENDAAYRQLHSSIP